MPLGQAPKKGTRFLLKQSGGQSEAVPQPPAQRDPVQAQNQGLSVLREHLSTRDPGESGLAQRASLLALRGHRQLKVAQTA